MIKMNERIFCAKIDEHNAEGLCSQRYCDNKPEYYFMIKLNGVELFVSVCKEHAKELEGFQE